MFYTEGQVAVYVAQCKTVSGATVHVNATGSVVCRIPAQKSTFYYCVLLADGNLPVLDILSSCHNVGTGHPVTQLGHMQVCTLLQTTTPAPHHSE